MGNRKGNEKEKTRDICSYIANGGGSEDSREGTRRWITTGTGAKESMEAEGEK